MRTRIYLHGKPAWSANEPDCHARVSGYDGSALGHAITHVKPIPRSVVPLREKDRRRKAAAGEPARRKAQAEEGRP